MEFRKNQRMPVTEFRSFANGEKLIVFSQPNNIIMIVDMHNNPPHEAIRIRSEKDGLGNVLQF